MKSDLSTGSDLSGHHLVVGPLLLGAVSFYSTSSFDVILFSNLQRRHFI